MCTCWFHRGPSLWNEQNISVQCLLFRRVVWGLFSSNTNFGRSESPSIPEPVSVWQCEVAPALSVMSWWRAWQGFRACVRISRAGSQPPWPEAWWQQPEHKFALAHEWCSGTREVMCAGLPLLQSRKASVLVASAVHCASTSAVCPSDHC